MQLALHLANSGGDDKYPAVVLLPTAGSYASPLVAVYTSARDWGPICPCIALRQGQLPDPHARTGRRTAAARQEEEEKHGERDVATLQRHLRQGKLTLVGPGAGDVNAAELVRRAPGTCTCASASSEHPGWLIAVAPLTLHVSSNRSG